MTPGTTVGPIRISKAAFFSRNGPVTPVGENTVRCEMVVLALAAREPLQLRPAPLSRYWAQRQVFGNVCCEPSNRSPLLV